MILDKIFISIEKLGLIRFAMKSRIGWFSLTAWITAIIMLIASRTGMDGKVS